MSKAAACCPSHWEAQDLIEAQDLMEAQDLVSKAAACCPSHREAQDLNMSKAAASCPSCVEAREYTVAWNCTVRLLLNHGWTAGLINLNVVDNPWGPTKNWWEDNVKSKC
jgi:hypothetical protein